MAHKITKIDQRDGYVLITKLLWGTHGIKKGKPVEVISAHTTLPPRGKYIGDARMAKFICDKMGLTKLQYAGANVCIIGFSEDKQKWFGWSHRAICGFGIGDKLFEENWPKATEKTPFIKHGSKTIADLDDAKQAAKIFARSVS